LTGDLLKRQPDDFFIFFHTRFVTYARLYLPFYGLPVCTTALCTFSTYHYAHLVSRATAHRVATGVLLPARPTFGSVPPLAFSRTCRHATPAYAFVASVPCCGVYLA